MSRIRLHLSRLAVAGVAACIAVTAFARQAEPPKRDPWALTWGRVYTQWLYRGEADKLWAHFGPDLRRRFGDPAHLLAFRDRLVRQAGVEKSVVAESFVPGPGYATYQRRAAFSRSAAPVEVEWTFGEFGTIGGFAVRPEPPPPPPP